MADNNIEAADLVTMDELGIGIGRRDKGRILQAAYEVLSEELRKF
jgi:hypothetical protein